MMWGCQGTRVLTEDQKLYTGAKINFQIPDEVPDRKHVENELIRLIEPKPNKKFLGMRPSLVIHNMVKEPKKEKGFRHWLKYKVGKPPVIYNEEVVNATARNLSNTLYHKGHFKATTTFESIEKKHTVFVDYSINAGKTFIIDSVKFPDPDLEIESSLSKLRNESLLVKGEHYDLDNIKKERERLDTELKKMGYYFFDPDYLIFRVDTSDSKQRASLFLQLKPDNPPDSYHKFKLGEITILDDYRLENYAPDTFLINNYRYVSQQYAIRPEIVLRALRLYKDSTYSITNHQNTIRQLTGTGYWKYATIRYLKNPARNRTLDARVIMSPNKKLSLSTEVNAVAKSNNFAGPGVRLGFKNRNFLGGAETFSINLNGSFETQFTGEGQGNTAYELSTDATLSIPRIIPFNFRKGSDRYVPFTRFQLGGGTFVRTDLYRFNTFSTSIGYLWQSSDIISHDLKPLEISFTKLAEASDEFKEFLIKNPSLRRSFEEQFIIGMVYNFNINKLSDNYRRNYFINLGIEPSGNLAVLLLSPFNDGPPSPDNQYTLFGNAISQFLRLRIDSRYHLNTGRKSQVAMRLFAGAGFPYGNSKTIPYVKQFFVGGPNSLRGFRARSVGPGTYHPPDSLQNLQVDQTGEIKIEGNIEYRFPIVGFLKGALFLEAGNIWLVNEDESRPEGVFEWNSFYKEFAVSSGFGLRIDANIFVLRFDWGFPLRKPWLEEGNRWVIDEVDFFSKNWRKQNLIINISIGYPF